MSILPDQGDPRRVGELVAAFIGAKVEEVDALVEEARERVAALPDQRVLWSLFGELLLRVMMLERDVADLKAARR